MKTQEEIIARLGHSVVAMASLCITLAIIIILMLNRKYTTDIEMAVSEMGSPPTSPGGTPVDNYTPAANGIDGKKLFRQNCAVCHSLTPAVITGPGLAGVMGRVPSEDWMHKWIKNPGAMKKSGDPYANKIDKVSSTDMTPFSFLSDDEINAIIDFISVAAEK